MAKSARRNSQKFTVRNAMQTVHIDYAGPVKKVTLLIKGDGFSQLDAMCSTASTTSTIGMPNYYGSRYALIYELVFDNGLQFVSHEF